MLFQLRDGRTVYISVSDYLSMSDQDINELLGYSFIGVHIQNPHFLSSLDEQPDIETFEETNDLYYEEDFDNLF